MNHKGDIYLVTDNTDMRKSINGLAVIVCDVLEMDSLAVLGLFFVIVQVIN